MVIKLRFHKFCIGKFWDALDEPKTVADGLRYFFWRALMDATR